MNAARTDGQNALRDATGGAALTRVTVVVVTSTIRGHPAEVPLGPDQGLHHECVANCDDILTIGKDRLRRRRGSLRMEDVVRLDEALEVALGLS